MPNVQICWQKYLDRKHRHQRKKTELGRSKAPASDKDIFGFVVDLSFHHRAHANFYLLPYDTSIQSTEGQDPPSPCRCTRGRLPQITNLYSCSPQFGCGKLLKWNVKFNPNFSLKNCLIYLQLLTTYLILCLIHIYIFKNLSKSLT